MVRRLATLAFSATLALAATPAFANPRPLPFTYQHEQLPEGGTELEQYVDLTPVRVASETPGDPPKWHGDIKFQTEFEHGITDRLELGLYVVYTPGSDGNGMKQRLRYKLADTGAWPIDVALYGEFVENQHEVEVEGRVILQRRFGLMRLMANLKAEQAFVFDGGRDFVFAPSGGATFELTPAVQPGIEWWMTAEYPQVNVPSSRPFELGPHHWVGPALMLQTGALWWTNGFYLRVSDVGHTLAPEDGVGNVWFRSVVGIGI